MPLIHEDGAGILEAPLSNLSATCALSSVSRFHKPQIILELYLSFIISTCGALTRQAASISIAPFSFFEVVATMPAHHLEIEKKPLLFVVKRFERPFCSKT